MPGEVEDLTVTERVVEVHVYGTVAGFAAVIERGAADEYEDRDGVPGLVQEHLADTLPWLEDHP